MFNKKKNRKKQLLQEHGKVKNSDFDFGRIGLYFSNSDKSEAFQVISDSTYHDLDMDELFMYLDRTCSAIGQQYLYAKLRTIPNTNEAGFESIIRDLQETPSKRESAILQLSKLSSSSAYFIQRLIFGENIPKPRWFWILPILSVASVSTLVLSLIYPVFAFLWLPVITANTIIHFWNKNNVLSYSNTIPQLLLLNRVASKLLDLNVVTQNEDRVRNSIKALRKIERNAVLFKWESKIVDEIGQVTEYLFDFIKAIFLFEPQLFFRLLRKLNVLRPEIKDLFVAVSEIDVALSIDSVRNSLPYYTTTTFITDEKRMQACDLYHPLTVNPVANNVNIEDSKSMLISGSNMSGKTTFIRTLGINTILAQTINTVCAKDFLIPRLQVHSAIRIADDLMEDTSYYYAEVKRIKELLIESEGQYQNLFLLDELFKGTNTIERVASGKAVLSYLNQNSNLVFASTHDLELTEFLSDRYNYFHFSEIIQDDTLTFDYKLKEGKLSHTNAIRILEINDFPKEVTEEAKSLAEEMNKLRNTQ